LSLAEPIGYQVVSTLHQYCRETGRMKGALAESSYAGCSQYYFSIGRVPIPQALHGECARGQYIPQSGLRDWRHLTVWLSYRDPFSEASDRQQTWSNTSERAEFELHLRIASTASGVLLSQLGWSNSKSYAALAQPTVISISNPDRNEETVASRHTLYDTTPFRIGCDQGQDQRLVKGAIACLCAWPDGSKLVLIVGGSTWQHIPGCCQWSHLGQAFHGHSSLSDCEHGTMQRSPNAHSAPSLTLILLLVLPSVVLRCPHARSPIRPDLQLQTKYFTIHLPEAGQATASWYAGFADDVDAAVSGLVGPGPCYRHHPSSIYDTEPTTFRPTLLQRASRASPSPRCIE